MCIIIGILFYHESDLQHASFWSKTSRDVLSLYSDSWRYEYGIYTLNHLFHHTFMHRFVYAHLHGKCRREVVLEYFGEEKSADISPCCDVCEVPQEKNDCSSEIRAILQSVNELSAVGEKR